MNEIISKAAEAAQTAIEALRTSPIVLALVIFQFITIGAMLYVSIDRQQAVRQMTSELHELVAKCITRP
jgi:hypothetical protein